MNTEELTSTTAPGKVFSSRSELAEHYKSDWHKYNLKRREAGLPVLLEVDFQARLQAARALRQEQKVAKKDHLKQKVVKLPQGVTDQKLSENEKSEQDKSDINNNAKTEKANVHNEETEPQKNEERIEIEPRQCLFDPHHSPSVTANVERMQRKYGFFIPDREYLNDLDGLMGYLHEKIKLGHICLYCQKVFSTYQGCQKHMIAKAHTKLRYEDGVDLDEFEVFYDFGEVNREFMRNVPKQETKQEAMDVDEANEEEGWEDISEDEAENETELNEEEDDDYQGYEEQVTTMGFDVTPLGEIIFPDGRIIGHRSLRRYYKQRPPAHNQSTAVVAAKMAAGERLYRGRVYNIQPHKNGVSDETAMSMAHAGLTPGLAAGRAGQGLLVKGPGGSIAQWSIYRYRAAIRKSRRESAQGHRLYNKTYQNINRMDKKANRIMNGVSVAHAAR